jgi:hypothetical protein
MSIELDLNINNYTLPELEAFLKVATPYSLNDILKSEKEIINVISNDKKYAVENKSKFITFIKNAKAKLVARLRAELDKTLTNEEDLEPETFVIQADVGKVVNQTSTITAGGGSSFVLNQETSSFNDVVNPNKYLNPVEAFPTNIARSNLNNLKRKTILQTVILNSLFREDYKNTSSTDFSLVLPYQFKNVLSVRLSSIQLPNVLYCFSKAKLNNIFYISECGDGPNASGTIILPDGNYNLSQLATTLQQAMNEQLDIKPPRFEVIAHESTQKITIMNNRNVFTMNFLKDIESKDFNSTFGWILGFRQIEYKCSAVYTSEAVYNSVASDYIYFILNDFNHSQSQNILAMYSKSYIGNNILAMIPLTSQSFHICFDNGNDFIEKKREYFGPVNLQRLKIELRNQYGELLDLNCMDFSFSLEVELGYDW